MIIFCGNRATFHLPEWWFGLSNLAMEEARHDPSLKCEIAKLEPNGMYQTKKCSQLHYVMKALIGRDADPGLVYTVISTAPNLHDVT